MKTTKDASTAFVIKHYAGDVSSIPTARTENTINFNFTVSTS